MRFVCDSDKVVLLNLKEQEIKAANHALSILLGLGLLTKEKTDG